ncbi:MAG: hypothetical protein JXR69_08870 [Candidatus Delongbacteria bacterium]|nr:hypothetical protein [Candidatus Delongbacteria bacterium]
MKKKWTMLLVVMFALTSIFLTSCKDDSDDPAVPTLTAFEIMQDYMEDNGMDITSVLTSWIKTASSVNDIMTDTDPLNDYYIMDIRSASAYAAGHIPSAVNVPFTDVVTAAANAGDKTIAVVCYSGQSACHAVVALRLSGYSDAFSIMWGMSGWHTDVMDAVADTIITKYDSWSASCSQLDDPNWTAAPGDIADNIVFDLPDFDLTVASTDGAEILAERVNAMLAGGFKGIAATTVLADPTQYFINNYWTTTDVEFYGNIDGAYRINPLEITNLDPSKQIVTYCWTGQTSSMITAYLNVLGFDAVSLKNGANSMIYDDLETHKWDAAAIVDLPLEVSP